MTFDAIVIGAGPNGLTAAITLAARGRKVVVLEAADAIGGHTRPIEFAPGFRTPVSDDGGWMSPDVAAVIDPVATRHSHALTVVDGDGRQFLFPGRPTLPFATPAEPADFITIASRMDGKRWPEFMRRLHKFAGILESLYRRPPVDVDTTSVPDILSMAKVGLRVRALGRRDLTEFLRVLPMSAQDLLDDAFENPAVKAALGTLAVRDLRQGPRSGATAFNLIHQLIGADSGRPRRTAWAESGPDGFAVVAAESARKAGVEIRTGARVEHIVVRDGAVVGVALAGGDEISAPQVLSSLDPKRTLHHLIDPVWLDPEVGLAVSHIKLRGCTALVAYAMDSLPEARLPIPGANTAAKLALDGPVSLTWDLTALEQAADAAKYGEVSAHPHVEFFAPTMRWPSLAPAGAHVVCARVQYAPYALRSGAWTAEDASALEKKVTGAIARVIPGFATSVKHARVLTPRDIEAEFGVTEGALTQGEVMLDQVLFMRPIPGWSRYAMPIRGLFLAGAGAHPGPGILGGAGLLAATAALRA